MAGRARPGDFVPPAVAQKRVSRYTFRMSRTYGDYWFYDPTATVYGSPRDVGLSFQDVHFDSESNRLHGWFFPAQYDEKTARALAEAPLPGIPASAGADRANRNNRGQSQGGHRKAKGTRRSSKAIASRRSIPPIDHLHDSDPAHASSSDHPQSEGNPQDNGHISRSSQESATVSANGRYDSHAMPHADRNGTADAMPGNRRHSPHDKNIADEAGNVAPKGTIIHFHGKGGNLTGHFKFVAWLPKLGWNLLVFDYRGFGRSAGKPSRAGTIADGHAAIDYLKTRPDCANSPIIMFGQSLGASVGAVVAADRVDLAGMVLEGAFASYQGVAQYVCRQSWMTWGIAPFTAFAISPGYDPIDAVDRIPKIPKLFIAGENDSVCDPRHTVAMFEKTRKPKELWIVPNGHHLAALVDTEGEGPQRIESFMSRCAGRPAATGATGATT